MLDFHSLTSSIAILSPTLNSKVNSFLSLPVQEPVIVFCITLLVILIVPFVFAKFKLPGIIGLILSGMLLGNSGFNILESNGSIELLGNVGLLYLMFLAGLELDMNTFVQNRNRNLAFGFLTFTIPFVIGFFVCKYIFNYSLLPSLLISSMFSTQTLIAYPIVSRLRLTKTEPVGIAIGGTIITDTIVLLLLILIIALNNGETSTNYWLMLAGTIAVYLFFIFYIFPRITRWFFKNTSTDLIAQYVFVLSMVFLAGTLAKLIKLEPIIGAFMAGIVLNRQIPHSSTLMSRIEFIGNAIFIPIFLLYVGMLIDLKAFISGWEALELSIVLLVFAISSKWIAAYITQKLFLFKTIERQLIFGLSSAHAAATIAIILIGYKMSIIDINVLNAAVIVVFVSCIVSAIVTERAAKKIVLKEITHQYESERMERIILPVSNPTNILPLIEFSNYIKVQGKKSPIYILNVVKDEKEISSKLAKSVEDLSAMTEIYTEFVVRMDINISSGIVRASKEIMASKIVMGWNGNYSTREWFFGSILEGVLRDSRQPVYVVSIKNPIQSIQSIEVIVPPLAEFEPNFKGWITTIHNLAKQTNAKIEFNVLSNQTESFSNAIAATGIKFKHSIENAVNWHSMFDSLASKTINNLIVIVSARKGSISHSSRIEIIPRIASKNLKEKDFIIIYPAQPETTSVDSRAFLSGTGQVNIEEESHV
ncbi:sodium:proton antiporter [Tenuifilaceae bacterium CYCD]|nr:sodium:proton antiporter [Tenuifilaceae bacterium CYCD]